MSKTFIICKIQESHLKCRHLVVSVRLLHRLSESHFPSVCVRAQPRLDLPWWGLHPKPSLCTLACQRIRCVWLFATLWTVPRQAPLALGLSRQEYGSGLPCPPPGDLPDLGFEPKSLISPALEVDSFTTEPPGKPGVQLTNMHEGFLSGSDSKESACNAGDPGSISGLGRFPGERNGNPLQCSRLRNPMQPIPVYFPGKSHGQRMLASCSPWGHKESERTEQLTH